MSVKLFDRVKQVTLTQGTGTISLSSTAAGFQSFSNVFSNNDQTYYVIENKNTWEVGRGKYNNGTIIREEVLDSSNNGQRINLSGKSNVFVTLPADKIVFTDESGRSNLDVDYLNNVRISSLSSGQNLTYNGQYWANTTPEPGYSDEQAQDAVGNILTNSSKINFSYNDNAPSISATIPTGAITNDLIATGIDVNKLSGIIDSSNLPSYVDDVLEYANFSSLPPTGESSKIYITIDTNRSYRWSGSQYVQITDTTALWGSITGTISDQTDLINYAVPQTRSIIAGTGLTGGGQLNSNVTLHLNNTTVNSGTYGSSSGVPSFTVDPQGRLTYASEISVNGILPTGGSAGQILSKIDGTNYNTEWIDNYAKEVVQYAKNSTNTTLSKGQVVYINGADGTNPTIGLAIASGESTSSKTLGFLKQDLNHGDFGYVVTEGFLDGLNTNGATTEGDPIWLSPSVSGGVIYGLANKPYAPNHLVFLGYVIRKNTNNGRIYVKIQNGFELKELHDVVAQSPNDGDIIRYISSSGLWSAQPMPVGYTDENAQDAVGGIVQNSSNVSLSYNDNTPSLLADLVDTSVVAGGYGSTNQVATFTVDAKGRLTAAGNATITPSSIGALGSLNGLTGSTQTFATGTSGTDFNIVSSGTAHTFNLPDASTTARGLVTTGTQSFAGVKSFTAQEIRLSSDAGVNQRIRVSAGELRVENNGNISIVVDGTPICVARNAAWNNSFTCTNNLTICSGGTIFDGVELFREARGVLYQYDSNTGVNTPQRYHLANIRTSNTSFERLEIGWASNLCTIAVTAGSAGGTLRGLRVGGASADIYYSPSNSVSDIDTNRIVVRASDGLHVRHSSPTSSGKLLTYNTFTDNSNYERLALQFGTYSSARHAQIAAESAGTGTANINLVLTPKGTGAFILGPPPDGTTVGGNARGANAIDLQTLRTANTQVASASYGVTIGTSCTAGGGADGCVAIGRIVNVADTAGGAVGIGRYVTVSGYRGIGIGSGATSTSDAIAIGTTAGAAHNGAVCIGSSTKSGWHGVIDWMTPAVPANPYNPDVYFGGKQKQSAAIRTASNVPITLDSSLVTTPIAVNNRARHRASLIFAEFTIFAINSVDSINKYSRRVLIKDVSNTSGTASTLTILQTETVGTDIVEISGTSFSLAVNSATRQFTISVVGQTDYAVTGNSTTNIITAAGNNFSNGDIVVFTALTGGEGLGTNYGAHFLPIYRVINKVGDTFQLAVWNSSTDVAVDFTTDITAGTIARPIYWFTDGIRFIVAAGGY